MKKLNTAQELTDLPNGSVVILGIDRTDVHPGVIQRQSDGNWYGIGVPFPITPGDILADSFPVALAHTGDAELDRHVPEVDDELDDLLAALFGAH